MTKKSISRLLQASLMCCLAVLFTACDDILASEDNPTSAYLSMSKAPVTIKVGDTFKREAISVTSAIVEYTSSDTNVATVDGEGVVTAIAEGETTITATATGYSTGGKKIFLTDSKSYVVTVKPATLPAATITTYLKWDNTQKELVATPMPDTYTTVENANTDVNWAAGTYVVEGDVIINATITLNGAVDLIIKDGAKLTVNQINGNSKNLSIYGQANQTGQLVVNNSTDDAITSMATFEVHSCQVKATTSMNYRAGFFDIKTFNVYGGSVDAEYTGSSDGDGIYLNNNSMNIYGGDVKAVGKGNSYGISGSSSTVTVYGGKLWAVSGNRALYSGVTLAKDAGFTGKIETCSDGSNWTEYTAATTPTTKYVRVGY